MFKVFDSKKKIFLSEDWNFSIRQNGELWFYSVHGMNKADDWFIPVFSSGRTDKNGVELFDRDIVKGVDNWNRKFIKEITYQNGVWWFEPDIPLFEWSDKVEKIGSKLTNPELME